MKAMYYSQFGERPSISNVPDPICAPHGVVLEIASSGLCMSDWHGWQGHDDDIRLPHVPGHEFAGTIVELGSELSDAFDLGQRVTVPFIQACGHCNWCLEGHSQVCPTQQQAGFTGWGSHAEYVSVSQAKFNLVALPEHISFDAAALLGCRYGTAMHAVQMATERTKTEGYWVVYGCGGVGLSIVQIANMLGQAVVAVDIRENALAAASSYGAEKVVTADANTLEKVADLTENKVAVTFDAVGSYPILQQCIGCLARRGIHIQVGLLPGKVPADTLSLGKIIAQELELHGCHGIPRKDYGRLLRFVDEKNIDPALMINKIVSLPEAVNYFANHLQYDQGGTIAIDPRLE